MGITRGLAATLLTAVLLLFMGAPASRLAPLPAPPPGTYAALEARYDATRHAVLHALGEARRSGDEERVSALVALSRSDRQLLAFDPAGAGRAVEVVGDLAAAERIAIIVPGADTRLETFDGHGSKPWAAPGGGARSVAAEAERLDPDGRLAVVAWLGYDTPMNFTPEVGTDLSAEGAAEELRAFVFALARVGDVGVSLLCHSYGAVVCAQAVPGLPVTDVALFGSPGGGVDDAEELGTEARIWAARGLRDWTQHVPEVELNLPGISIGFGADPTDPAFGARTFTAGSAGHSDYLEPGSSSLHDLAAIALGAIEQVDR